MSPLRAIWFVSESYGRPSTVSARGPTHPALSSSTAPGQCVEAQRVRIEVDWKTHHAATAEALVQTPAAERNGDVSPNGCFLAFESDESERFEIHVRPYPQTANGRWQLSTSGGTQPVWTSGGQELVYLDATNHLTIVPVETAGATFLNGMPTTLPVRPYTFSSLIWRAYDVSRDGQRFLILKENAPGPAASPSLVVVQNFQEELKRLVPARP